LDHCHFSYIRKLKTKTLLKCDPYVDTRRSLVNTCLSITFTQCIIFNCNRILLAIPREEMNTLVYLKLRTCGKCEDEIVWMRKRDAIPFYTNKFAHQSEFFPSYMGCRPPRSVKTMSKGRKLNYVDIYIVMTKNQKNSIHRFLNTCCNEHTIFKISTWLWIFMY
jgi:hypothetical protein